MEVLEVNRELTCKEARGETNKVNHGLARLSAQEEARVHLVVRGDLPLVHSEDRAVLPVSLVRTTPRPFSRALVVTVYHHLRGIRHLQDDTLKISGIEITPWTPRVDWHYRPTNASCPRLLLESNPAMIEYLYNRQPASTKHHYCLVEKQRLR